MNRSSLSRYTVLVALATIGPHAFVACSSASDSTTGKRVVLDTEMIAESTIGKTFTTGFGWDVELSKALVASSGFYYFDGPPPTALLTPAKPGLREHLLRLFEGTAWAHPGHYQAGTALGQVVFDEPIVLDLFEKSRPVSLPSGDGVTGTYRSARFVLSAPSNHSALDGHVAIAEGVATKHDGSSETPIHFRLVADDADVSMSVNDGAVDGCVLDEVDVTGDGKITLEIRPTIWLNLVDFSKIDPGSDAEPTEAHDAGFSQGVAELSAYHFSFTPN